jgi:hypothetical protein
MQRACAGFEMMGMIFLRLQLERDGRSVFARLFAQLRAACRLMHRAIVDAKIRRLESELMFMPASATIGRGSSLQTRMSRNVRNAR